MSRFRPIDRKTAYLLPPSVEDWLAEDHLARFIVEAIEQLDLSDLVRAYAGRGSTAYHPEVMLGLLVYGSATGLFSSRKIERATYDSVAFRYLAAGLHPGHDTRAQAEKAEYEEKLAKREAREAETGKKPGGKPPRPPEEGPKPEDQINLTDEESRIMKVAGGGFEPCFAPKEVPLGDNAQAAVAGESMLVVATGVTQAGNDNSRSNRCWRRSPRYRPPWTKSTACRSAPANCSERNIAACEATDIEPFIAVAREDHHPGWRERFTEPEPLEADAPPLKKMTGEWTLVCLAWNLKRLAVLRHQSVQCS